MLDWGPVTPEAYNDETREAFHVLNVNCIGTENRDRVCRFVAGRILHFSKHLPPSPSQRIRFDLRGQHISNTILNQMRESLIAGAKEHGIALSVEYLTN